MHYKTVPLMLLIIVCSVLFVVTGIGFADDTILELSLEDCIDRALKENLNLKSAYLGLRAEELSIVQAESYFDPSVTARLTRQQSEEPNYIDYIPVNAIERKSTIFNVGIGQNLATGARWGFGINNTLSESNIERETNYSSSFGLSMDQPLLRDFGKKVNQSTIYLARLSQETSSYDFKNHAMSLIYDVQNAYWNLVYARETLKVREMSLEQADSLLAYTEIGLKVGILTESDLLDARSAVLSRKLEILQQENTIREVEDLLKRYLNLTSKEHWNVRIMPNETATMLRVDLSAEDALLEALEHRPDWLSARAALKEYELRLTLAKNDLKPSLNLNASYQVYGSGNSLGRDYSDMKDIDRFGWQVGLNFAYPLGNRAAKAALDQREISLKRARLNLDELQQSIITDIHTVIRRISTDKERIEVARISMEVNELKLKNEEERFRNQLSSSYLVLEFQKDLESSRNLYNKTLMDYTMSVVDLQMVKGTFLKDHDIHIITREN